MTAAELLRECARREDAGERASTRLLFDEYGTSLDVMYEVADALDNTCLCGRKELYRTMSERYLAAAQWLDDRLECER